MMRDIYSQFGVGKKDAEIDANGICMASIQGVYSFVEEQATQMKAQQAQLTAQTTQLEHLERLLKELVKTLNGKTRPLRKRPSPPTPLSQ